MSNYGIYQDEKFLGIPIPQDGVSFGSISVNNITALLQVNNYVFGGSLTFSTVTITLKGIGLPPPFASVSAKDVGKNTFQFRDKTWNLLSTSEGSRFKIAGETRLASWTCTGVDLSSPKISV